MDRQKLFRFFKHEANDQEVKEVLDWLYSNSFEDEFDTLFKKYLSDNDSDRSEWREYEQLRKIKDRMRVSIPASNVYNELNSYNKKQRKKRLTANTLKIAAVVSLLVAAAFIFVKNGGFQADPAAKEEATLVNKATSKGQKSTIFLEDGSKVVLNAQSSVRYPETFSGGERVVELEGEAFFEVASDPAQPFIVRTGGITTTALGTSFNINANDTREIVVSLVTGQVLVKKGAASGEDYVLDPGEEVAYKPEIETFVRRNFDPQMTTAWTEGIIYFRNANFDEIMTRLERWYGVNFIVSNRPGEIKHYTGKFINENLENVLGGIGFTNNFNYRIEGKNVHIEF